jgi:hypothetical protein
MADAPNLRLLVGGTLVEGEQATLEDLPEHERGGAAELIKLFGGPKQVFLLRNPRVYQGSEQVRTGYLVLRSDQCRRVSLWPTKTPPAHPGTRTTSVRAGRARTVSRDDFRLFYRRSGGVKTEDKSRQWRLLSHDV